MMFKVGDEVVCVDAKIDPASAGRVIGGWSADLPPAGIVEGEVYTIKAVGLDVDDERGVVWVLEVRNTVNGSPEKGYLARRFRKVERKNYSLSIEAFLTIKPGFEEPKRTPAKKVPA